MTDGKEHILQLFQQHYRPMFRLAVMLLHDEAESKDVVHDVFAKLLSSPQLLRQKQGRDDTPQETGTTEAFLLTCVRNRCLNVIRNRQIQERIQRLYLLDASTPRGSGSLERSHSETATARMPRHYPEALSRRVHFQRNCPLPSGQRDHRLQASASSATIIT